MFSPECTPQNCTKLTGIIDNGYYPKANGNRGCKEGGEAAVYKGNQAAQDVD